MTQEDAAKKLGVSQAFLSLFEKGKRPLAPSLAKKAFLLLKLPPTSLPLRKDLNSLRPATNEKFVKELAALKYPGFSYVEPSSPKNPVEVLLSALKAENLEARLVEALPWLLLSFPDMDWKRLTDAAKLDDLQNRLGFLASLACKLAAKSGERDKAVELRRRLNELERSRLAKEDTLCRQDMTKTERNWILKTRTEDAAHWNLVSDLSEEHLRYAA